MEEETKETETTKWRIGVLSAAKYRDAMISEPVDDAALADTLRKLSAQLPPGFKAFAFASRGDRQFDDGVAAAAVDSLAALAAFSNEPSFLEAPRYWYGCDIRRRVRFDEECDAKSLARQIGRNDRLSSDFERRVRRLRFLFEILAALFLALAAATAWMAFRGKPALQEQHDKSGEDGHQQPVAARGEAGEDLALLPCALLGVEGVEAGVRELAERDAGRSGAESSDDSTADELCVDERGGDLEDGGIGVVGVGAFAGLRPEDAVFDVVHAADSTTGATVCHPGAEKEHNA